MNFRVLCFIFFINPVIEMNLPPYDKFPEIASDAIVLRQIRAKDIKDLVEISFYDSRPALTIEDAIEMQNKINSDYQNGSSVHWGIAGKQTDEVMGTLGYYRGLGNGVGELGCVLRPGFRGQGFMTAAMKLAIEFGFTTMGLAKIVATTTKQNHRAVKLLARLGFVNMAGLQEDIMEYQLENNCQPGRV